MDSDDAAILLGVRFNDVRRAIGRAVIDENNFEVLVSLTQNRIKASRKVLSGIIDRDDNGNEVLHKVIIPLLFAKSNFFVIDELWRAPIDKHTSLGETDGRDARWINARSVDTDSGALGSFNFGENLSGSMVVNTEKSSVETKNENGKDNDAGAEELRV